jgi:hypothetical protein
VRAIHDVHDRTSEIHAKLVGETQAQARVMSTDVE